jgi:hypothetical protein
LHYLESMEEIKYLDDYPSDKNHATINVLPVSEKAKVLNGHQVR